VQTAKLEDPINFGFSVNRRRAKSLGQIPVPDTIWDSDCFLKTAVCGCLTGRWA
jgi:hypothetical protein